MLALTKTCWENIYFLLKTGRFNFEVMKGVRKTNILYYLQKHKDIKERERIMEGLYTNWKGWRRIIDAPT